MKMVHKAFLRLLLLLLLLLLFLGFSSVAVPTTSKAKWVSSVQDLFAQGALDLRDGEEVVEVREGYIERRIMDFESTDYPGTGANNHHDPNTPGSP